MIEVKSEVSKFTSFIVTLPTSRNLVTALERGELKLNYNFLQKSPKLVSLFLEEKSERILSEIKLISLHANLKNP